MTARAPVQWDLFESFAERGRRAQGAVDQILAHGAGLTFGELEIGARFTWPPPMPPGPEPLIKVSDLRYEWSGGYGTAETFYRVERWTEAA